MMNEFKSFAKERIEYLQARKNDIRELENLLPAILGSSTVRYIFEINGSITTELIWDPYKEKIAIEIRDENIKDVNAPLKSWDFATSPLRYRAAIDYDDFAKSLMIAAKSPYQKEWEFYEEKDDE